MSFLDRLGIKLLFALDPETAHGLSIAALKTGLPLGRRPTDDPALRVEAAGLSFPNPLGMSAGYDKNADVPDALLRLGFGFADRAALKIAGDFGKLIAVDRDFAFAHILRRRGGVRPQGAQQQPEDKPRQARKCEEENYFIRRKQHGDRLSPGFEMAPV